MKIENIERVREILAGIKTIDSYLKSNAIAYRNSEIGGGTNRMIKVDGIQINISEAMAKYVISMNLIDLQNQKANLEIELKTL